MIHFEDTKDNITLEDISIIEKLVNLSFPKDYKNHLLKHNGGYCEPNQFDFFENGEKTSSIIDTFFAIINGKSESLLWNIEVLKFNSKRLPIHIIPIADDPGGNLICLSCGSTDYGSVYFWNHEREVNYSIEDDNNYDNLYFIANSFTSFLEGLYEETDE